MPALTRASQSHHRPIPPSPHSTPSKPAIPSPLAPSTETSHPNLHINKKKLPFSAASFRGFGCTARASRQVSLPAVIRASADWQQTKPRKKKHKRNGAKNSISCQRVVDASNSSSVCRVDFQDVWCGPGIGLSADVAGPADSGIARNTVSARGKTDMEKMTHSCRERFTGRCESLGTARYYRHVPLPHPSSDSFPEMMLHQGSVLMGGRLNSHDYFRDWRLDVDNMSYEQLLELGERIGYVNTGLKEDEIGRCIRKLKLSKLSNTSKHQVDKKCSICQEEYEGDEEVGRLNCEHSYHYECLRQWVAHKNWCPVCKQEVVIRHSLPKS